MKTASVWESGPDLHGGWRVIRIRESDGTSDFEVSWLPNLIPVRGPGRGPGPRPVGTLRVVDDEGVLADWPMDSSPAPISVAVAERIAHEADAGAPPEWVAEEVITHATGDTG